MSTTWKPYSDDAVHYATRYESVRPDDLHRSWSHLLPRHTGLALDVGAGSGRDAAWLARTGLEVIAVEPAAGMREQARAYHDVGHVRWLDDRLPGLDATRRLDCRFDVILVNAVWQHVAPDSRPRAVRKLADLLKPGGLLVINLRHGPPDPARRMWPNDIEELRSQTRSMALQPIALPSGNAPDFLGRDDISWTTHAFRSPDDGTGALPVLRHVIVNDSKSSTYKLALLRVLVRIADGARGMVLERDSKRVVLPLGLVALYWLRAFQPLLRQGRGGAAPFPQLPGVRTGPGFVRGPFRALAHRATADFHGGSAFTGDDATNLTASLAHIASTIRTMPAHYTTWPHSDEPIFRTVGRARGSATRRPAPRRGRGERIVVDRDYLASFGTFAVPAHLWQAMSSYACWLEPAIIETWCDLMRAYDLNRGRTRSMDTYRRALVWLDPERTTRDVRRRVEALRARSRPVYCVWTGARLRDAYEVDHCLPFASWPNGDLWNLLPSSRRANHTKRARLPSGELLHVARQRIVDWWGDAWVDSDRRERFEREAATSLPMGAEIGGSLEGIFAGVDLQRVRLRVDQQLAEWDGRSTGARR